MMQHLVTWAPFLVLILVMGVFMWRQGERSQSMLTKLDEQTAQSRDMARFLERIAIALETRGK